MAIPTWLTNELVAYARRTVVTVRPRSVDQGGQLIGVQVDAQDVDGWGDDTGLDCIPPNSFEVIWLEDFVDRIGCGRVNSCETNESASSQSG